MKKNGFTLIELLGVVVLLALLAIVIFPSIIESVRKVNTNNDDAIKKIIISAAKDYYQDNLDCNKSNTCCININKLIQGNYISNDIIDDSDYQNYFVDVKINNNGTKEYEITKSCSN